jgi:hypothetical protein
MDSIDKNLIFADIMPGTEGNGKTTCRFTTHQPAERSLPDLTARFIFSACARRFFQPSNPVQ